MADKETGLNITVGAVADENSAKKAVKDITKAVDSSVKGGRIEVPVDITVPIDKSKDKLTKAQKDITDTISKMMSKGFSASGKDIDTLVSKFNKFTKAFDKAGKGRQNKTFREIRSQVDALKKSYTDLQKAKKSSSGYSKEVIDKAKDQWTKEIKAKERKKQIRQDNKAFARELSRGAGRGKASTPGADINLGNRSSNWDDTYAGVTDKKGKKNLILQNDMLGTYYGRNSLMKQMAETEKLNRKAKVTTSVDKSLISEPVKPLSDIDIAAEKAVIAAKESTKVLGGIEHGREDADPERFKMYAKGVMDYTRQSGKTDWDSMSLLTNMAMNRYNGAKGVLGLGMDKPTGEDKNHGEAKKALSDLMDMFTDTMKDASREMAAEEARVRKVLSAHNLLDKRGSSSTTRTTRKKADKDNSQLVKELQKNQAFTNNTTKAVVNTTKAIGDTTKAVSTSTKATENQIAYDKIEHDAERVADSAAGKKSQELVTKAEEDLNSGFNTDNKADEAIAAIEKQVKPNPALADLGTKLKDMMCPCKEVLESILAEIQNITKNGINISEKKSKSTKIKESKETALIPAMTKALMPISGVKDLDARPSISFGVSEWAENMKYMQASLKGITSRVNQEIDQDILSHIADLETQAKEDVSRSKVTTTKKDPSSIFTKLIDGLEKLTGATANYRVIMSKTSEEQDQMNAQRIETFGLNRGRNTTDNGDKINFARSMSLWRGKDKFKDLFKDVNLTEGIEIDTTAITDKIAKVLSGREMFQAQTGGWLKNIFGAATGGLGFAFQPSLEKSRARAEGVNQIMANIRKAMNDVLQDIQDKESKLSGMKASGALKLGKNGEVLDTSTTEAKSLVLALEESKQVLASVLADTGMVDQVVGRTHGKINGIVKQLGFTSPVLRENNKILANINAGLDKNGKALKFQTRLQEILNYGFQLMGRHIGQLTKHLLLMLNPLNLIKKGISLVKSAFQDFGSYDTKWQRTMNVIKINFQRVIRPAMQWIAQGLVNVIGFLNIISMKVQEAFGQIPIDLFDQAGAQAEKIRRELEEAANVTTGFDELHDIGSDNSGANDLLGDIYKPQLSQEWIDLANRFGDTLAGLIKGDLGFGEAAKEILKLLGELLGKIAGKIWDWFKETAFGKWLIENWKKILASLLAVFLAWKLLKIAGSALFNALFGKLLEKGVITGIFSKIGGWISGTLASLSAKGGILGFVGSFGQGIILALQTAFTGGKYSLFGTLKEIFTGHAAITQAGSWGSILGFAITKALGAVLAGAVVAKGFDMVADDASYNMGLEAGGGKDKDKKSGVGGKILGAVGGAALAGLVVGGPIAMGIGAIAGLIITSLAPAFEELAVKAKDANNEMQKIEYYEGKVQGAQTQVDTFDEQLNLLNQTLKLNTQAVYDQGEKLGISKARMDELVKATQNGTFTTSMLTGSETELSSSLVNLAQQQSHTTEITKKLEEAQKKLLKAQTELSIAQDVEAGNFELAAARIELAEAQEVYTADEATKKRIQIYKQGGDEERKNLLQNLTPEQRKKMAEYNAVTDKETKELVKIWQESSNDMKKAFLDSVDTDTQNKFQQEMNSIDNIIKQHQGFWQGVGDTIAEIFTFGNAKTWTYNGQAKYEEEVKKGKFQVKTYAVGTNYVPNDGLAYLHQGEAVIPKKYNQPYQPNDNSSLTNAIEQLNQQVALISSKVDQGIDVHGQFVQKGSDLVATVQKANNKLSNNILNNKVYAR